MKAIEIVDTLVCKRVVLKDKPVVIAYQRAKYLYLFGYKLISLSKSKF